MWGLEAGGLRAAAGLVPRLGKVHPDVCLHLPGSLSPACSLSPVCPQFLAHSRCSVVLAVRSRDLNVASPLHGGRELSYSFW